MTLVVAMMLNGLGPWVSLDVGSPGLAYAQFAPTRSVAAVTATSGMTLAVWLDRRRGTRDLFAARISAGGVVLDATGVPLAEQPTGFDPPIGRPAIATDGSSWLVAWRRGTAIEYLRFDQAGVTSALATASATSLGDPAVRFDQGAYVLA
jgi:hypothetical protein